MNTTIRGTSKEQWMSKVHEIAEDAVAKHARDGMTVAVGGFGLSGIPRRLIEILRDTGVRDLTVVSNDRGVDGKGLGLLLENEQVTMVVASYVGENKLFARQYLEGVLDVELCPQGTLAERLRAGGSGIAGFYTRTGVGTGVATGKEHRDFHGHTHILEQGIVVDLALVHAHQADAAGNLRYRRTARNFNPLVATAGRVCIAEAEQILPRHLDPDDVMTPGIFVDHVVQADARPKDIEQRTTRPQVELSRAGA